MVVMTVGDHQNRRHGKASQCGHASKVTNDGMAAACCNMFNMLTQEMLVLLYIKFYIVLYHLCIYIYINYIILHFFWLSNPAQDRTSTDKMQYANQHPNKIAVDYSSTIFGGLPCQNIASICQFCHTHPGWAQRRSFPALNPWLTWQSSWTGLQMFRCWSNLWTSVSGWSWALTVG